MANVCNPIDKKWIEETYPKSYSKTKISSVNGLLHTRNVLKLKVKNDLLTLLKNRKICDRYVNDTSVAESTKITRASTINGFAKKLNEKYNKEIFDEDYLDYFNEIMKTKQETRNKDKGENKGKQNVVAQNLTLQDIYDCYDYYEKFSPLSNEHLYLATITFLPPRRLDWGLSKFVKDKVPTKRAKETNYIVRKGDDIELDFYAFKTYHILGVWKRLLKNENFMYYDKLKTFTRVNPDKLASIIKESYEQNPRTYFIEKDKNKKFGNFSQFITQTFRKGINKQITNTDLRQVFITAVLDHQRFDKNTLLAICFDCGQQSLETQYSYYRITDENINEIQKDKEVQKGQLPLPEIEVIEKEGVEKPSLETVQEPVEAPEYKPTDVQDVEIAKQPSPQKGDKISRILREIYKALGNIIEIYEE